MPSKFIWQRPEWPDFRFDERLLAEPLRAAAFEQGEVAGALRTLGRDDLDRAQFDALTDTIRETSEIEGEHLRPESIRASLTRRLAFGDASPDATDPRADGVVAMTIDAMKRAGEPLTRERLFRWHDELFADAPRSLTVGAWRVPADDPMRVSSGPAGSEIIHFEAPPAAHIDEAMSAFLTWFENQHASPALLTAALAHLWFVTIHPFADGNGRIARAIGDLAVARREPRIAPYVSLARQIRKDRTLYYDTLEETQRANLDVTTWMLWFVACYRRAIAATLRSIDDLTQANHFWNDRAGTEFNARQRKVLERVLAGGFDGWINSSKYAKIAGTSPDTAQRDILDLVAKGVVVANDPATRKKTYRLSREAAEIPHSAVRELKTR